MQKNKVIIHYYSQCSLYKLNFKSESNWTDSFLLWCYVVMLLLRSIILSEQSMKTSQPPKFKLNTVIIYFFNKYLSSTYYVLGTRNKTTKNLLRRAYPVVVQLIFHIALPMHVYSDISSATAYQCISTLHGSFMFCLSSVLLLFCEPVLGGGRIWGLTER